MTISAAMVKELRDKTGAGMMDCKAALTETGADMEAAVDWLRAKGLSKAAKKAGRVAAEGLVAVASSGTSAAVVELNSETDFVARNEQFQDAARNIAKVALENGGDLAKTLAAPYPGAGHSVEEHVKEMVGTIGENMSVRRAEALSVGQGAVATYVHNQVAPGLGKIGVLVAVESTGDAEKVAEFGRQVAMHVAATSPLATTPDEIDPAVIERERAVLVEQARESGKPEEIIGKMVEGRIRKFYEEVALVSQAFVINPDLTVAAAAKELEKQIGAPVAVKGFVRMALGEGIEREEADFAAEVRAAAGS
ncbi:MAG: translation elongation factor Ts [Flavobacteriaceae bacterium]